ncbi:hypothetical protein Tco_0280851 [Tanacetum coccineum]
MEREGIKKKNYLECEGRWNMWTDLWRDCAALGTHQNGDLVRRCISHNLKSFPARLMLFLKNIAGRVSRVLCLTIFEARGLDIFAMDFSLASVGIAKGFHSPLDEGTRKSKPLLEGKLTDTKDLEGNKQPFGIGSALTHPNDGVDTEYQVDKTQSTRFEVSDPNNKSKTYSELELDSEPLILIIVDDIQALLGDYEDEHKDDSDDDMFEAGEEMDEEIQQEKHEEVAASYADLRGVVEGFAIEAYNNKNTYDIAINSVMENVEKTNAERIEEHITLPMALNRVTKTLEDDLALKASMQKMTDTNTTTSGIINDLSELIRNANLPKIIT